MENTKQFNLPGGGNKPFKLLKIKTNSIKKSSTPLDIIPCKIDYNGKADVDNYFRSKISEDEAGNLTTNLYGRNLKAKKTTLPENHKRNVLL